MRRSHPKRGAALAAVAGAWLAAAACSAPDGTFPTSSRVAEPLLNPNLPVPVLASPTDFALVPASGPLELRASVDDPSSTVVALEFEIDTRPDFPSPTAFRAPTAQSQATVRVPGPFTDGKLYYWRARARDANDDWGPPMWAVRRFVASSGQQIVAWAQERPQTLDGGELVYQTRLVTGTQPGLGPSIAARVELGFLPATYANPFETEPVIDLDGGTVVVEPVPDAGFADGGNVVVIRPGYNGPKTVEPADLPSSFPKVGRVSIRLQTSHSDERVWVMSGNSTMGTARFPVAGMAVRQGLVHWYEAAMGAWRPAGPSTDWAGRSALNVPLVFNLEYDSEASRWRYFVGDSPIAEDVPGGPPVSVVFGATGDAFASPAATGAAGAAYWDDLRIEERASQGVFASPGISFHEGPPSPLGWAGFTVDGVTTPGSSELSVRVETHAPGYWSALPGLAGNGGQGNSVFPVSLAGVDATTHWNLRLFATLTRASGFGPRLRGWGVAWMGHVMTAVTPTSQSWTPSLPAPELKVQLKTSPTGLPAPNVPVTFSVTQGPGVTLSSSVVVTDANGYASTYVQLGGVTLPALVRVQATADVSAGSPLSFAINAVQAVAASLSVAEFPSPTVAGRPGRFRVRALDAARQPLLAAPGTLHFSSSDPLAELPPDTPAPASPTGSWDFTATFHTPGVHQLQAELVGSSPLLQGAQAGIAVAAPPFQVVSAAPATARCLEPLTWTAEAASDAPVRWTVASGPRGLAIDAATGAASWTPTPEQAGRSDVVLEATLASGGVARQAFTLSVDCPAPRVDLHTSCGCGAGTGPGAALLVLVAGALRRRRRGPGQGP